MGTETRFWTKFRRLERRVLDGPASLDATVRRRAAEGKPLPDPAADCFGRKIHRHAYRVVDGDVEELKRSGWSQDQIFELSIAAAFGAARLRLEAGMRAMGRTEPGGRLTDAGGERGRGPGTEGGVPDAP
jgi:hypothetical protein